MPINKNTEPKRSLRIPVEFCVKKNKQEE